MGFDSPFGSTYCINTVTVSNEEQEMQQEKFHFIYKTTNVITNKYYIGMHSTDDLNDGYLGSGKRLILSVRKYGVESHVREILEFCDSREALCERERSIISEEVLLDKLCLNLKLGGKGGYLPVEACRKGGQQAHTSANTSRNCTHLRDENVRQKARLSLVETLIDKKANGLPIWTDNIDKEARAAKLATEEVKEKRKATMAAICHQQGASNSQFGTCWIHKESLVKKVKRTAVQKWLDEGWLLGRK